MRISRLVFIFSIVVLLTICIDLLAKAISIQDRIISSVLTSMVLISYAWASPVVLQVIAKNKSLTNIPEELKTLTNQFSIAASIRPPKLIILESKDPIALGVGMPGLSAIFISRSLLSRLEKETLEFVVAHEISHIALKHSLFQAIVFSGIYLATHTMALPPYFGLFVFLAYLALMRTAEFAADSYAQKISSMATVEFGLKALSGLSNERPSIITDFLSTHPNFSRRLSAIQAKTRAT